MGPAHPYDLREFRRRCDSTIGLRVLELLAEGRHTADDMKRILKQEADAGRRWWRGRRLRTDPGSFSFWASEKEGRNHGYRAYEDASGYWHVEAREEPALKPVRYGA